MFSKDLLSFEISMLRAQAFSHCRNMKDPKSASLVNWKAFWNFHLGSWEGRWARYQPTGELSETFLSSRSFQADPDKKVIKQLNQYLYTDGQYAEKDWNYSFLDHCKEDGFMHPASDYMRGLAFNNGSAAWLVPHGILNQYFPMELFLANKNVRHSVGMLYGINGTLERTACIREQRAGLGQSPWSDDVNVIPAWNVGNNWRGVTEIIDAALNRSRSEDSIKTTLQPNENEYFFPDNIILRCPKQLSLNKPFVISSLWLESTNQLRVIMASYGSDFKLIDVRLQHLSR